MENLQFKYWIDAGDEQLNKMPENNFIFYTQLL